MKYISGCITNSDPAIQKRNLERFYEVEKRLGEKCLNPADHGDSNDRSYESYLVQDIILIFENRPDMYFMLGWETSRGARIEHELALKLGLKIEYETI